MGDLPPAPPCDFSKYPPTGYDSGANDPCDEWPPVPPQPISGCTCPPDLSKYDACKASLFFNFVPIAGQMWNQILGMPSDCLKEYEAAADLYAKAQAEFAALCSKASEDFLQVVVILNSIYKPDDYKGTATGILPDTLALALQPGFAKTLYLSIVIVAIFLVVIALIITL